jgi:hypothetical protein
MQPMAPAAPISTGTGTIRSATPCEVGHTRPLHVYTGRCDEAAARAGIEWMRERYRERGERAPF